MTGGDNEQCLLFEQQVGPPCALQDNYYLSSMIFEDLKVLEYIRFKLKVIVHKATLIIFIININ